VHIETFLGKFMISQSPGGTVHRLWSPKLETFLWHPMDR